jgi:hypothetical protein
MRTVAILLVLALFGSTAAASHLGSYAYTPVERDDQGRSVEPDFASTSVLGPFVENRVVDADRDGVATPDGALPQPFPGRTGHIAPGCTDDTGRRPSGLCGLYTAGLAMPLGATARVLAAGLAGVQGMGGDAAPGAFTPTKATQVRLLDAQVALSASSAGTSYVEVNRKLDDAFAPPGTEMALAEPPALIAGTSALWAWYGKWQDKNGNGVIDSFYDAPAFSFPPLPPHEEFQWFGNCRQFGGGAAPPSAAVGLCAYDAEAAAGSTTAMHGFLYPSNHHSYCGGALDQFSCSPYIPADLPGRQVVHFLGQRGVPVCADRLFIGPFCAPAGEDLDAFGERWLGDPLLDDPGSVRPDQTFDDRTGDPRISVRGWFYGLAWPTWFYDEGLLTTLIQVTTVGCRAGTPNLLDLPTCRFADVDAHRAWHPETDRILAQHVKPAARGAWLLVRDNWPGIEGTVDGVAHHRLARGHDAVGPLDDAAHNPGFSREPNDPADAYPAARHNARGCAAGQALHHGWCNDYAAHLQGPRGFGDLLPVRAALYTRPIGVAHGCFVCLGGAYVNVGYAGEAPGSPVPLRLPGDHRRTLGPGEYYFTGIFGRWHDQPQTWDETTFEPLTLTSPTRRYAAPPDGWVGNLVNSTGTFHRRGYAAEGCTTEQGPGTWPYAWCHPYLDGALQQPQQLALGVPSHGEFSSRCVAASDVVLTPADGRWDVPVFVWRDSRSGIDLLSPPIGRIEDHTGRIGPIVLRAQCAVSAIGGAMAAWDNLLLPLGNLREPFTTSLTVDVGDERLTDADTYHGWGA